MVRFTKADRKIERMRPYLAAQAATGRSGVAAIGVAQEYATVFTGTQREAPNGIPWFSFTKADRRVTCYYFYLWDDDFGPAFIKICAYFPYPAKIWINGHEWAKRQATHAGIGFTELSNGFAATDDPAGLQAICDRLGPATIDAFAERWFAVLPLPLTDADRAAGYWWETVDAPGRGLAHHRVRPTAARPRVLRGPRRRQPRHRPPRPGRAHLHRPPSGAAAATAPAPQIFKTKVVTRGVDVTVNAFYKHSRIKQYLKDGRALRIETVINDPYDLGCQRRLHNLPELQPRPVPPTAACSILNGSARAASSRVQPLSGSRTRPPRWTGGGPQPCGSATLGSKPWPAPCASPCSPSPASPTRACAP